MCLTRVSRKALAAHSGAKQCFAKPRVRSGRRDFRQSFVLRKVFGTLGGNVPLSPLGEPVILRGAQDRAPVGRASKRSPLDFS